MTMSALIFNENEKNWLFYLVQPTRLLSDIPNMPMEAKLSLLKQFLSQAELADRKAFAASKLDVVGSEINECSESRAENSDVEPPYKKSKILDALALQLAAVLKFNLNLFRNTFEIPIRLLARLYRVLVTVTAKNSTILQPLFEQVDGKDNLFKINPYAAFDWRALHPTTIYAIFSYHVWCLQVSFASSMLPQPFRNLTPAVSGLTEVPDTVFFADNRVEVSVILERVAESVAQITQISALLDEISLARPLPTAFPLIGPGLPPSLGAPLEVEVEERVNEPGIKPRQNLLIRDAEPLSKEYLELSIKFILGRHAFQLQNFPKAEEMFTAALGLMKQLSINYAEEVGVTANLLETYLQACKSYDPERSIDTDLIKLSSNPRKFVEAFCELLDRDLAESSAMEGLSSHRNVPFWCQTMVNSDPAAAMRSPNRVSKADCSSTMTRPTCEDHLYQILMEDLHVEDNAHPSELVVPLGWSLRKRLEELCLRTLITMETTRSNIKGSRQPPTKQPKLSPRIVSVDSTDLVTAVQHLYTKVRVCNVIERLVSETFAEPVLFATLLITASERTLGTPRSQTTTICSTPTIDPVCGWEFLFDCLDCFLHVLSTQPKQRSCVRVNLVNQFVLYIVQHGLALLGQLDSTETNDSPELVLLKRRFLRCLHCLAEHDLFNTLSPDVQTFVRSVTDVNCDQKPLTNEPVDTHLTIPGLPDPEIEMPTLLTVEYGLTSLTNNFTDSMKLGDNTVWPADFLNCVEPFCGSKKDVDMRNTIPPFFPVPCPPPYPTHPFRPGVFAAHPSPMSSHLPDSCPVLNGDTPAMSVHAPIIRLLLTTCSPSGVSICVRKLITLWPAARILALNSAWIPCLRRLASLELASTAGILNEKGDEDPLNPFLSSDHNSVGLLIAAIQLSKASLCLEHQIASPNRVQSLLLAALSELTTSTNTMCPPSSGLIWFRAALRHELLLLDLLGVLDPLIVPMNDTRSFAVTGGPKTNARRLNDLSRRAKICLFHAAGLSANAAALENKMDANMPLGLSTMLVCSASCFLLWNGECDFLLPTSKRMQTHPGLPKGALPARGSTLGALDLIRALLRLHEAVSVTTDMQMDQTEGVEKRKITVADDETRPVQADRVKTAINNLWNLIVFGCLVPELANSNHNLDSSTGIVGETKPTQGRSQITLSTLVTVARMLACSSLSNLRGHCATEIDHSLDIKRRFGHTHGPRRPSPTLYLLTYLITCLAHITRAAVCHEFQIPKVPSFSPSQTYSHHDPMDEEDASSARKPLSQGQSDTSLKSDLPESVTSKRKRTRWNPSPDEFNKPSMDSSSESVDSAVAFGLAGSSLLSNSRWPTEVPSSTKLPTEAVFDLLLLFVNAGLAVLPSRIDWLLLRAELEFQLNQSQAALRTYLEVCAVVTDSFLRPLPSFVQCEEIISRMVRICQTLGLLGEAVVLCQLAPEGSLIELGLQLINSMFSDSYPPMAQPVEVGAQSNDPSNVVNGQELISASSAPLPTTTLGSSMPRTRELTIARSLAERPRGACGGFLARNPWDCLDNLVDYLWDLRLLETLSSNALIQGALGAHTKFNASLNLPELNVNNREEILRDGVEARTLDFLRWMSDEYL